MLEMPGELQDASWRVFIGFTMNCFEEKTLEKFLKAAREMCGQLEEEHLEEARAELLELFNERFPLDRFALEEPGICRLAKRSCIAVSDIRQQYIVAVTEFLLDHCFETYFIEEPENFVGLRQKNLAAKFVVSYLKDIIDPKLRDSLWHDIMTARQWRMHSPVGYDEALAVLNNSRQLQTNFRLTEHDRLKKIFELGGIGDEMQYPLYKDLLAEYYCLRIFN